ncbi:hypothetical protein OCU04_011214 [Sclerotinia nivalis]|uniref:Uncharacterized protein n=1 Tax=Sclerotinia nivalis TaxID=352851 RepID=A0A9X0AB75_9HELO|nr:hypothetical protein OCU04_011214 [Sclerotinia nivalis]
MSESPGPFAGPSFNPNIIGPSSLGSSLRSLSHQGLDPFLLKPEHYYFRQFATSALNAATTPPPFESSANGDQEDVNTSNDDSTDGNPVDDDTDSDDSSSPVASPAISRWLTKSSSKIWTLNHRASRLGLDGMSRFVGVKKCSTGFTSDCTLTPSEMLI